MNPKNILIVEDDAAIVMHLQSILDDLGYRVCQPAATGEVAITAAGTEAVDLVLMDIQLAGKLDSITAARRITSLIDVPVIFLTNFGQDSLLKKAKEVTPYGYLLKPISTRVLAATLEMALHRHSTDRQLKKQQRLLQKSHEELEQKIGERTRALAETNEALRQERDALKETQQQLVLSKTTLATVFDGISDPLFVFGTDYRLKVCNRAAKEYIQANSYEEILGRYCYQIFYDLTSPCDECRDGNFPPSSGRWVVECPSRLYPGRNIQVFSDIVNDESGNLKAVIVRISDVTETRLMEQQQIQNEKLTSLGLLIGGMAHEINNPNNFIYFNTPILRSYLQFLLPIADTYAKNDPQLSVFGQPYPVFRKDCLQLLDNIEHGSVRINKIVENLQNFIRKRDRNEKSQVDLKLVAEKAVSMCLGQIKKQVRSFTEDIQDNLPLLYSDPIAIEQIMINLLINAGQAMDKQQSTVQLSITCRQENPTEIHVRVRDNGCGMDDEMQQKIFVPFFTTKAPGVGTGMGLAVCHRLVTELGGRIEVISQPTKGSTFLVALPLESHDPEPDIGQGGRPSGARHS